MSGAPTGRYARRGGAVAGQAARPARNDGCWATDQPCRPPRGDSRRPDGRPRRPSLGQAVRLASVGVGRGSAFSTGSPTTAPSSLRDNSSRTRLPGGSRGASTSVSQASTALASGGPSQAGLDVKSPPRAGRQRGCADAGLRPRAQMPTRSALAFAQAQHPSPGPRCAHPLRQRDLPRWLRCATVSALRGHGTDRSRKPSQPPAARPA
jgi:hypothetical protein